MRRMWPDEFNKLLDGAEEVTLNCGTDSGATGSSREATTRQALRLRLPQEDYERIWPLAETRYRLQGGFAGKAITLIVNNPHYSKWHPADGGTVESISDSGRPYATRYVLVHFLLDDVRETAEA